EGVNEWADAHVMAEIYGARGSMVDWLGWQAELSALRAAGGGDPDLPSPVAAAAYAFVDSRAYRGASDPQTPRALGTRRRTLGTAKFLAAMKSYANAWAFRHPTGRDLFAVLDQQLGPLDWFFEPAFHEVGGMHVALRTAACRTAHPPRGVFGDKDKTVTTEA